MSVAQSYITIVTNLFSYNQLCSDCLFLMVFLDPSYQQHVPNLDGGEGASQHILFGSNVDWHTPHGDYYNQ